MREQMTDLISRQAAIDALDVLCQEHRYKIPGKSETYSQYNKAWQDAMDRAENEIWNLPSSEPERKNGRITYTHFSEELWGTSAICISCGCKWQIAEKGEDNFCPNCGAYMREREGE